MRVDQAGRKQHAGLHQKPEVFTTSEMSPYVIAGHCSPIVSKLQSWKSYANQKVQQAPA